MCILYATVINHISFLTLKIYTYTHTHIHSYIVYMSILYATVINHISFLTYSKYIHTHTSHCVTQAVFEHPLASKVQWRGPASLFSDLWKHVCTLWSKNTAVQYWEDSRHLMCSRSWRFLVRAAIPLQQKRFSAVCICVFVSNWFVDNGGFLFGIR